MQRIRNDYIDMLRDLEGSVKIAVELSRKKQAHVNGGGEREAEYLRLSEQRLDQVLNNLNGAITLACDAELCNKPA